MGQDLIYIAYDIWSDGSVLRDDPFEDSAGAGGGAVARSLRRKNRQKTRMLLFLLGVGGCSRRVLETFSGRFSPEEIVVYRIYIEFVFYRVRILLEYTGFRS